MHDGADGLGPLNTLAGASSADTLFDVQVIWDPTTKRFYYTMIDSITRTNNDLAFGLEQNPVALERLELRLVQVLHRLRQPVPRLPQARRQPVLRADRRQPLHQRHLDLPRGGGARREEAGVGSGCPSSLSVTSKSPLMSNGSTPAFTPVPANEIDTKQNGWIAAIPSLLPSKKISLFKVKKKNGKAKIQGTATQLR